MVRPDPHFSHHVLAVNSQGGRHRVTYKVLCHSVDSKDSVCVNCVFTNVDRVPGKLTNIFRIAVDCVDE